MTGHRTSDFESSSPDPEPEGGGKKEGANRVIHLKFSAAGYAVSSVERTRDRDAVRMRSAPLPLGKPTRAAISGRSRCEWAGG